MKLNNKRNKIAGNVLLAGLIIFGIVLFSGFVFADTSNYPSFSGYGSGYSSSSYQYQPSYQTYYGSESSSYWPILGDKETCQARQDVILQISPGGCEPMVVRSDLLADQNVPVFCQVDALQVNPLIDIKSIRNIRFSGNYPAQVLSVGFHPAKAALNTRDKLLGNPTINNIGYVVVVLKRTPNETALPNSVALNLTGVLEYDVGNAFGVGTNEFYLEEMDDSKWAVAKNMNSFWNGKFFVRADRFDEKEAYVSIYYGDQKISSQRVDLGKDSNPIYLPGSYCNFGVIANYNGITQATDKARIEVTSSSGTSVLDVYQGSKFLNGACTVKTIELDSQTRTTGIVTINCGSDLIRLSLSPTLNVEGLENGKISFMTIDSGGKKMKECKVDLSSGSYRVTKGIASGGTVDEFWSILQKYNTDAKNENEKWQNVVENTTNNGINKIREALIKSCDIVDDQFKGDYGEAAESAFNDSIASYTSIAKDFPSEKQSDSTVDVTYGQRALENALGLVSEANKINYAKSGTKSTLLSLLIQNYPETQVQYQSQLDSIFSVDSTNSGNTIRVDNQVRAIRLISLSSPLFNETAVAKFTYGMTQNNDVRVNGTIRGVTLSRGFITLESFDGISARLRTNCTDAGTYSSSYTGKKEIGTSGNRTFSIKIGESREVCGNTLLFRDTSIPKVAKIILKPNAYGPETETNLSVKIGIEKRAIQLSPAKAQERVNSLNASIKKWEGLSKGLGNLETGLKAACFATSAVLTVKNFISGMDGTAMARNNVMSKTGGWIDKCKSAVNGKGIDFNGDGVVDDAKKYDTVTQCFEANKARIEKDVNSEKTTLTSYNENIKAMEKTVSKEGVLNEQEAIGALATKINTECNDIPRISELPVGSKIDSTSTRYPYSYSELQNIYVNCLRYKSGQSMGESSLAIGEVINSSIANADLFKKYTNSQAIGSIENKANTLGSGTVVRWVSMPVTKDTINGVKFETLGDEVPLDLTGYDKAYLVTNPKICSISQVSGAQGSHQVCRNIAFALVVGTSTSNKGFQPGAVYEYTRISNTGVGLSEIIEYPAFDQNSASNFYSANGIGVVEDYGQGVLGNVIDPQFRKVKYFSSGPDKDLPSQVPFDVKNGWYAKVDSSSVSFASNTISNFDSSGLPKRWQICNVGTDGGIDSRDACQEVINGVSTSAAILGLDEKTSADLVARSRRALLDAASQKGGKLISINGEKMNAEAENPLSNIQCETFMSRDECKILFNVCDPVICPPSRCNLGGSYQVSNVQQTGIVGSAVLCLPNAKEGIMLPVCISGIRNGIDMYVTLLKQYRDCMQENLNSGKLVGICDEIQSIYMCEFFWRQAAPIANMLLPKLLESAYGSKGAVKGGGEYLFVKGAWDNAASGMDYFTNYYAQNTMKAFQVRSVEEAGTEVCKGFISAKVPTNFKSLLEPDSPSQFYARFDETTFTTATVPPTSQYKVFYTIYAGKDSGSYYSVYLKNPGDTGYTYTAQTVLVSSGYIAKGGNAQEAKDFTAPQGYKELCVKINAEEKCGFKQVTTDFSVNYLRDNYVQGQINASNIKTQAECVSGTADAGALLANVNPLAAVEESALPSIYKRGILRICATNNPGGSTDPTRYVNVGYCGDSKMRCWLDANSVNNAITAENVGMKNETMAALQDKIKANLVEQGAIVNDSVANAKIAEIADRARALKSKVDSLSKEKFLADPSKELTAIKNEDAAISTATMSLYNQLILNNHKAKLLLARALSKEAVARAYLMLVPEKVTTTAVSASGCAKYPDLDTSSSSYFGEGGQYGFNDKDGNQYNLVDGKLIYSVNNLDVTPPNAKGFTDKTSTTEKEWIQCLYDNLVSMSRADTPSDSSGALSVFEGNTPYLDDAGNVLINYGVGGVYKIDKNNVLWYHSQSSDVEELSDVSSAWLQVQSGIRVAVSASVLGDISHNQAWIDSLSVALRSWRVKSSSNGQPAGSGDVLATSAAKIILPEENPYYLVDEGTNVYFGNYYTDVQRIYHRSKGDTKLFISADKIYEVTNLRSILGNFVLVGYVNLNNYSVVLTTKYSGEFKSDLNQMAVKNNVIFPADMLPDSS